MSKNLNKFRETSKENHSWFNIRYRQIDTLFRWDSLKSIGDLPFIRGSAILVVILPILDKILSPIIEADFHLFLDIATFNLIAIPGDATTLIATLNSGGKFFLPIELGIPFSLVLIYIASIILIVSNIIYQLQKPSLIGDYKDANRMTILQNFRKLQMGLNSEEERVDHWGKFFARFPNNILSLEEEWDELEDKKNILSLAQIDTSSAHFGKHKKVPKDFKLNPDTIYFYAERMLIDENNWEEALGDIKWYLNRTKRKARWFCGIGFSMTAGIAIFLVLQGFVELLT